MAARRPRSRAEDVRGDIVFATHAGHTITVDGEEFVVLRGRDVLCIEIDAGTTQGPVAGEQLDRLQRLLSAVAEVQAGEAENQRGALLKAMMAAGVDPVPAETVAQARRLARQRDRLLAAGAYTTHALQELRGDSAASATRTWLARRRAGGELFTVTHDGSTLVPVFQLDDEARPRPEIAAVLGALAPTRLGGWAIWTWFTAGSAWLGGTSPIDLLDTDPERVATAAARFAANAG